MDKILSIETIPVRAAKFPNTQQHKINVGQYVWEKVHRLELCQLVHCKLMAMEKVCP